MSGSPGRAGGKSSGTSGGKPRRSLLRRGVDMLRSAPPAEELREVLDCAGRAVEVVVRRSARARRIILRLPPGEGRAVVIVPPGVALDEGLAFARSRKDWIAEKLAARGAVVAFRHGVHIPFRGEEHLIVHVPGARGRGSVWREEVAGARRLCVAGAEEHLPRRLTDWLKEQARRELLRACRHYAQAMEVRFSRLMVRDQKSRWGSSSTSGTLSFSWRVILAPPMVLDYLAAHEVAHLREMNHSPRFWRLVAAHCPHWRKAEAWLDKHGARLHQYGGEGNA